MSHTNQPTRSAANATLHAQIIEAIRLLDVKDYAQSEERFRKILDDNPNQTDALLGIAQIHANKRQFHTALEYAQKALASNPHNVFCLGFCVQLCVRLSRFDAAKQYAQKAYKLEPKTINGIKTYLLYLMSMRRIGDAPMIANLVSQLLKHNKSARTYSTAGNALQAVGKTTEAIRLFRNGIRMILSNKAPPPRSRTTEREGRPSRIRRIIHNQENARFFGCAVLLGTWHIARNLSRWRLAARRFRY